MDDLDDLLSDLSRGSVRVSAPAPASASQKKARPASSFVDLNELEDLMQDLAQPASQTGSLKKPAASSSGSANVRVSTLDFGLDDLGSNSSSTKTAVSSSSNGGKAAAAPAAGAPRVSQLDFGLDDLLDDLSAAPKKTTTTTTTTTTTSYSQKAPPPAAAGGQYGQRPSDPRVSQLDFGLADLNNGPGVGAAARVPASQNAAPRVSALDFGLDDLSTPASSNGRGAGASSARPAQSAAAPRVSTLDFGLDDLSTSKPRAPVANVMHADETDEDDLDSLMSSLSKAPKPAAAPVVSNNGGGGGGGGGAFDDIEQAARRSTMRGGAKGGGGDDLDSMLSSLGGQMADIDDTDPSGRGKCHKCKQAITTGEVLQAMGCYWHPEHWSCENCGKPIGTDDFYEQDGMPHCASCYKASFCPRCGHCAEPIMDKCISAIGKKWHTNHFVCKQCLGPFTDGQFFERDGAPYCQKCFMSVMAPRCAKCDGTIQGDCVNAIGSTWHPQCFVCSHCGSSFAGGTFFESGGKPFCATHYSQATGAICKGCGKAIQGKSVTAGDSKFHAECFRCSFCFNPLQGNSFVDKGGKSYCRGCHANLFQSKK